MGLLDMPFLFDKRPKQGFGYFDSFATFATTKVYKK